LGDLTMIPFCCMATLRRRRIPDKVKKTLPPFEDFDERQESLEYMFTPNEAFGIFRNISPQDYYILGFGGESKPENLCYRVMTIVPAAVQMRSGSASLDSHRHHVDSDIIKNLRRILMVSKEVKNTHQQILDALHKRLPIENFYKKLLMQEELLHLLSAAYVHRDWSGIANSAFGRNKVPSGCIVDYLLLKDGLVRGGMATKRDNFSARSTIAPGDGLDVDQVGVPMYVCMKATQQERVDKYNKSRLQDLVNCGPFSYPGAKRIARMDGHQVDLQFAKATDRRLQVRDVVERHQLAGDRVIMNRQPTLHRPSMLAKRVVPHSNMPFLLALQATIPFNADFDGDEMNLHVPQNISSNVECNELMSTDKSLITQQDGPALGAKQNGIIISYLLTDNRRFYGADMLFNAIAQLSYFPLC